MGGAREAEGAGIGISSIMTVSKRLAGAWWSISPSAISTSGTDAEGIPGRFLRCPILKQVGTDYAVPMIHPLLLSLPKDSEPLVAKSFSSGPRYTP